jgi:hypothetical protein
MSIEPSVVWEQLERIEHSSAFGDSARLVALLRFLVEKALNGEAASLKESIIGNAVYGRSPPYDPRIDSTVRVEARRLRRKLQEYYSLEGKCDPVVVSVPTGAYVPIFEAIAASDKKAPPRDEADHNEAIVNEGSDAARVIIPFRPQFRDPEDVSFASVELAFATGHSKGLRIGSPNTGLRHKDGPHSLTRLISELGLDAWLQAALEPEGQVVRVSIEVFDPRNVVARTNRLTRASEEIARPRKLR